MTAHPHQIRLAGYLSLFGSVGTLVCCALPALLVVLGLGVAVASVVSSLPWLVTLSHHKGWVFAGTGLLMAANFYYVYGVVPRLLARGTGCAPGAVEACARARTRSRALLWISAFVYAVGFGVAYLLAPILQVLAE